MVDDGVGRVRLLWVFGGGFGKHEGSGGLGCGARSWSLRYPLNGGHSAYEESYSYESGIVEKDTTFQVIVKRYRNGTEMVQKWYRNGTEEWSIRIRVRIRRTTLLVFVFLFLLLLFL